MTLALSYTLQVQNDIQRITGQLNDLQKQLSSGRKGDDLAAYGSGVSRLVNAKSLIALADARISTTTQLDARFAIQADALSGAATSSANLAQSIAEAVASDDGRTLDTQLDLTFSSIKQALNETWNGQPLFAGERMGAGPIKIADAAALAASTGPSDIYEEASRRQTIDLGTGAPIDLADKASEISQGLFDAMKQMKQLLDASGGQLGQGLTPTQKDQLQQIALALRTGVSTLNSAEGRTGQLQKRLADMQTQLQARADLLTKEVGDESDADIAQVAIQLSTLQVQYQATAKSFADIASLSLLNYL